MKSQPPSLPVGNEIAPQGACNEIAHQGACNEITPQGAYLGTDSGTFVTQGTPTTSDTPFISGDSRDSDRFQHPRYQPLRYKPLYPTG